MSLEPGNQSQPQLQLAQLESALSVRPEGANSEQLIPAKREPDDDDIQFVSSHPVKKPRLRGEEAANDGQAVQAQTQAEAQAPSPHATGQENTPVTEISAAHDTSRPPDRSISAAPLGLASHLSAHAMWENRGTSLPAMENFSFQTAYPTASARSPASAAVSPKQVHQSLPLNGVQTEGPQSTQVSPTRGVTIDQVPCLDISRPQDTVRLSGISNPKTMDVMANSTPISDPSNSLASMSNRVNMSIPALMSSNLVPGGGPPVYQIHPQAGYMSMNGMPPAPLSFSTHPMSNHPPFPHMPPPCNPSTMTMTGSPGLTNGQAFNQQHLSGAGGGQATNVTQHLSSTPANYSALSPGYPPPQPTSNMMTTSVQNLGYAPSQSQQPMAVRRPCLACLAARQRASRGQAHGQHHVTSASHHLHRQIRPAVTGQYHHQLHPPGGRLPSAANPNSNQLNMQGASGATNVQSTHPYWQAGNAATMSNPPTSNYSRFPQGPFVGGGAVGTHPLTPCHSATGRVQNSTTEQTTNSKSPSPAAPTQITTMANNPRPSLPAHHHHPPPTTATPPRHALAAPGPPPKPPTTQPPLPLSQQPPQRHSQAPLPQPQPLTIPAATTAAAAHLTTRPRNQHAQNLLVDVAETVSEIFPYELMARRHGCAAHKVVEALAAVVQVPLLRCASDKRRAGKLGGERMREIREARKVWVGRERGRDGEEGGRQTEDTTSSRGPAVVGQPSAFDIATLLGPVDAPDVLMGEGVFMGSW